jgi:tetratricopeptide (TPR) repeat protein
LAAARGDVSDSIRYYHNAIFGVWQNDPEQRRRQVRFELCEFLLSRGLKVEAQAALIELATDIPKDAALHARIGRLFLRAEDYARALGEFQQALRIDSRQEEALRGAGVAAFEMASYSEARRYLDRAVRRTPSDARSAELLEVANLIISNDPLERRLTTRERARRTMRAYEQAAARLRDCLQQRGEALGPAATPHTELQFAYARAAEIRPKVRQRALEGSADLMGNVTDLAFEIEKLAARECGPAKGLDLALLLVARKREGAEP